MRIYAAAALLLACYLLPWVVNPSASLTANGYDLAEWSSLHPVVQSQTPPLFTSLLLRLPLACVGLLTAFGAHRRSPLAGLTVLVTAAALLPPPEFAGETGNPNYRQEAVLVLATLIAGGIGVSGLLPRYRRWIAVGIAVIGGLAGLTGLAQAYDLMLGFGLAMQIGAGGVGLVTVFAVAALVLAAGEIRGRNAGSEGVVATANQTG